MKLSSAKVRNFRMLRDAELAFEDQTTVIVGRNNSGKTSLAEVIRRFSSEKNPSFRLQDFSAECFEEFHTAYQAKQNGHEEKDVRHLLPFIELRMCFQYDPNQPELGPLGEFVVDLDMDCTEALVVLRFELTSGAIERFFDGLPEGEFKGETQRLFFREIEERIKRDFVVTVYAEDPNDATNQKESSQASVKALLNTGFINAQRGLDDTTTKDKDVLAKVLEGLFTTASQQNADKDDKDIAARLEEAVRGIQETIDGDFRNQLNQLLPAMQALGYPGLSGTELTTETTLDVQRLLTNHTKVRYEGQNGVLLPESYNGLGMRNLIFILLQIVRFYREFKAEPEAIGVQLVVIEEPEAHLHPQMQEVFIRQIDEVVKKLGKADGGAGSWPVQFLVSTHSSHIANEARFEAIRYFLPCQSEGNPQIWHTKIKDLRKGMSNTPVQDRDFLHQYLTLTRCDLFFADKAILIEGTTERLMLPVMIEKRGSSEDAGKGLQSQYVATMEVGGAYAHKFFDLLDFLELQALIVTDLDPVNAPGGTSCLVHDASATSNACVNTWFGGGPCNPNELVAKPEKEKIKGRKRIAFQVPEGDKQPCGRTFEDAFILANSKKFSVSGATPVEQASSAWDIAGQLKKTEFALLHAIDDQNWKTPTYLDEGLSWLEKDLVVGTEPTESGQTKSETPVAPKVSAHG